MGGNSVVRDGEALQHDETFLRALLENTSEGLLTIDADSRIVYANPAIERILGYEPAELVGSSKMRIIPERLRPAHEAGLEQYLATGERHIDWTGVELPALHAEGHEVPVSVSLREHEYDGERLFTGIITDVSERRRREETLREQKRELEEFADVLAHDLRNPLTVAEGYLELAREAGGSAELRKVDDALERVREIIDDTLAQAQDGRVDGSTEVMPFGDVMRMAWDAVPTGEARLVLPEPSWRIRADESRVCQLVENLVRNSIEHAGETATVRIGILAAGSGFYVEDDGPGLPEEVRVGLETPGGPRHEREGYGLQIVRTVADEHDWEVRVTDAESGGARFEFHGARVFEQ